MDPRKAAAEWFYNTVFKEEAIQPRASRSTEPVPSMIRTARSLEKGARQIWQSRETIFMKQAKLLAAYEDDYDFSGGVTCYYPTYQALTDRQLRGYFSWRTRLRKGDVRETSLSFAFLYIYELLNQIGVEDPADGFRKLKDFQSAYGELESGILPHLKRWVADYVIYYGLDRELLEESPQVIFDQNVTVLERIQEQDAASVVRAARQLSNDCLKRSRFYTACQEDMDAVVDRVLRRVSAHYASHCKKPMVEQYLCGHIQQQTRLFDAAVFCDPLKRRDYQYRVDEQCVYTCKNGVWSVWMRPCAPSKKLANLLKTIDSVMRDEFGYRYPVQAKLETKWILQIIREEARAQLAEKKAAEEKKIAINYTQLTQIRRDAAATRDKLIVDEELEEEPPVPPEEAPAETEDALLAPAERRLLQCLLYGGGLGWVQAEGYLLSVLVDGVNEKLYDAFQDSVLDDTPQLIEDYIDDLKEMVDP